MALVGGRESLVPPCCPLAAPCRVGNDTLVSLGSCVSMIGRPWRSVGPGAPFIIMRSVGPGAPFIIIIIVIIIIFVISSSACNSCRQSSSASSPRGGAW